MESLVHCSLEGELLWLFWRASWSTQGQAGALQPALLSIDPGGSHT